MGADFTIHILDGVSKYRVKRFGSNVLGGPFWNRALYKEHSKYFSEDYSKIANTPQFRVGEVSWLKAALFDDDETFIPDAVGEIAEIFRLAGGFVFINEELIDAVTRAMLAPNNTAKEGGVFGGDGYEVAKKEKLVEFLREHIGKEAFTVSW